MKYNPHLHNRQSIRLRGFDYSTPGAYFVTICVKDRECLFGKIHNGVMRLNELGKVVEEEWERTKEVRSNVDLDEFVVMPNHFHGIVIIKSQSGEKNEQFAHWRGVSQYAPPVEFRSPSNTVGAIVRSFKSMSTKRINNLQGTKDEKVWQRGYFDYIIRNKSDLDRIRGYIRNNVANWNEDEEDPTNGKKKEA